MRRLVSHTVLILMLILAAWLGWRIFSSESQSDLTPLPTNAPVTAPLSITGMDYHDYENSALKSRISVDQIEIRPRVFSGLRIHALNEIVLKKVRFDLYRALSGPSLEENGRNDPAVPELSLTHGLSSNITNLARFRGAGRISRALFEDITLNIFEDDEFYLSLEAGSAVLDLRKKSVEFSQALLYGRDISYRIATPLLKWHEDLKLFELPGDYLLIFDDKIFRGRAARINSSFQIRVLPGGMPPEKTDMIRVPQKNQPAP